NFFPSVHRGALFIILNQEGKKIGQFGNNTIIQDALEASGRIRKSSLTLSKNGYLAFSLTISGNCYIYDIHQQRLLHQFSIQGGPEYVKHEKLEEERAGYPHRISDVAVTSTGHVIVGFGGRFKDDISIAMMFDEEGRFMGRIFRNKQLKYPPDEMVLINDTTLWMFSTPTE